MGVLEIDRSDAANALGEDVGRNNALPERQGRQDGELGTGVEPIHIGGGIGFGVTRALSFEQYMLKARTVLFYGREDVVTGSVEDSVKGVDPVGGDALAQDIVDGNSSGDAGFHGHVHARCNGFIPKLGTRQSHQFFVGGDHRFLLQDRRFDNFAGDACSTDKFGDDVDVGMIDHLAPVRRSMRRRKGGRHVALDYTTAAYRHDRKREAELLRDHLVIFREDVQGPEADVSETNNADVYGLHGCWKLYDRAERASILRPA